MAVQGWIVTAAFVALILLVLTRVALLRRRGIEAFLFGATNKSDAVLVPCILIIAYCIVSPNLGWPIWHPLVARFWSTPVPGWFGVVFCVAAVAGMAWTLKSFGDSFRVGIDDQHPAALVTSGAFAVSRNPIYVCFVLFILGLFLTQHDLITVIVLVVLPAVIHRQVLREELFLAGHYGESFQAYRKTVRRYL
jgi:protein-S-isoprenylcysteine O-methyltransferase Ste14